MFISEYVNCQTHITLVQIVKIPPLRFTLWFSLFSRLCLTGCTELDNLNWILTAHCYKHSMTQDYTNWMPCNWVLQIRKCVFCIERGELGNFAAEGQTVLIVISNNNEWKRKSQRLRCYFLTQRQSSYWNLGQRHVTNQTENWNQGHLMIDCSTDHSAHHTYNMTDINIYTVHALSSHMMTSWSVFVNAPVSNILLNLAQLINDQWKN